MVSFGFAQPSLEPEHNEQWLVSSDYYQNNWWESIHLTTSSD